ncbi:thimet oligopeptidase [Reichenbachiella faecimaris]|uniref:Thimet oligopeptidase n=1 Tax=Reichenbachiella faecimaris TaxID=692418 RepID=A0A1W2G8H9_REIFA|nr:M3 family metallopeptidase [Reichenbachiella faecimaris]SMD32989.1 thimet oligopeptidase [Reichenbachiella faecimaris]
MRFSYALSIIVPMFACQPAKETAETINNPFVVELNEPVDFANVTAADLKEYGEYTINQSAQAIAEIKAVNTPTFNNVFGSFDDISNNMATASNKSFLMYWTSPDSLIRATGLAGYKRIDSLSTGIYSDKDLFNQMVSFTETDEYKALSGKKKLLVDDLIDGLEQSGVGLNAEDLAAYKKLNKEINDLTAAYATNMNTANELLVLNEVGAEGLPENFKKTYAAGESRYEVPVINATSGPIMKNAAREMTRKNYYMKFNNRASDKNLAILDSLVQKRYELAQLMGYDTYADYNLVPKMAKNPANVWDFVNGLVEASKGKAKTDLEELDQARAKSSGGVDESLDPWDISYYKNEILKNQYNVDPEEIRNYLPMDDCLDGMFAVYQNLLNLEFKKVEGGSVWHAEVDMYEVYDQGRLKGRFYLDLFPRPNKETWFYCVPLVSGKSKDGGYEVPEAMLLGNFTRPTETLPSLLSHGELSTLFHEFGHIMDKMAYEGEYSLQSGSKSDFTEAMSQIFENWIWDYETVSSFAKHYETGEVLPEETFNNMLKAKNVSSGYSSIKSLRNCIYDLNLYNLYDPNNKVSTDDLWKKIDGEMGLMDGYVEGTHPQSSWIHINTHPVYYYGYLWSDVYAQDMFSEFEKNGLQDQATGVKYRKLILANGSQRDIVEAVEEFLGRPSNNEAYMKSLGL